MKKVKFIFILIFLSEVCWAHIPENMWIVIPAFAIPTEYGIINNGEVIPYFGWEWQIPIDVDLDKDRLRISMPYSIGNFGHSWENSLGFRFSYNNLFASFNSSYVDDFYFNPELGVRICLEENFIGCANLVYGLRANSSAYFNSITINFSFM